jgi:hypothetical protein
LPPSVFPGRVAGSGVDVLAGGVFVEFRPGGRAGFSVLLFGAVLGADLTDSLVNDALDFIGGGISVPLPDIFNGALKRAADGLWVIQRFHKCHFRRKIVVHQVLRWVVERSGLNCQLNEKIWIPEK